MTTQTLEKANGNQTTQQYGAALRPFGLLSWDPFQGFGTMRQLMDSIIGSDTFPGFGTEFAPAVNLYEKDGTYTLECAVPGYKKEDITVEARGDEVMISGSYSQEKNEDQNHYHRHELRQGSFSRTVTLPQEINPEQVVAKVDNGMLEITLQPSKAIQSRTVPISG